MMKILLCHCGGCATGRQDVCLSRILSFVIARSEATKQSRRCETERLLRPNSGLAMTAQKMRISRLFFSLTAAFCFLLAAPVCAKDVLVASFSGVISPVSAEYLGQAVKKANSGNFGLLVIRLDTPGGLDLAMRDIVKDILGSKTPVALYVSPSGARAASAGVFIGMACSVLAMAPGTNIGAAHPVMLGESFSQDKDKKEKDPMEAKVLNDASAYLKSIAEQRKRNADWAVKSVTESKSISAEEALKLNVADVIADDLPSLLSQLDGREISGYGKLETKNSGLVYFNPTARQKFLSTVSDPNVAMILMSLGAAGLLIELYNPGLLLPGIVGGLSLITAFYSFHTLSANFAGVLLMLLGIICFVAEIHIASYGLLTVGGAVSVLFGALMLFKGRPEMGLSVSYVAIAAAIGSMIAAALAVGWLAARAQTRKIVTGIEAIKGKKGIAKTALSPEGKVLVSGELWDAKSTAGNIPAGAEVRVESADGFKLSVKPE